MKLKAEPVALKSACPRELDQLASDMLTTLDRIVHHLMTAVISEQIDEEIPLTLQEIRVFKTVGAVGEPVTMNALASAMRISLPTATHLVDSLVSKGVVVRTRTREDRRLVLISRSAKAKAREQKIFDDRAALILSILEKLTRVEQKKMAKALSEIALVFQAMPGILARSPEKAAAGARNSHLRQVGSLSAKGVRHLGRRASRVS